MAGRRTRVDSMAHEDEDEDNKTLAKLMRRVLTDDHSSSWTARDGFLVLGGGVEISDEEEEVLRRYGGAVS